MVSLSSLENKSDKIRWSLDLRFQTPDKSAGFHGMKGTVLFRTAKDPNHEIEWEDFNGVAKTYSKLDASWHSTDDQDKKEVNFVPLLLDLEFHNQNDTYRLN